MSPDDVKRRVAGLASLDSETAHISEDALYRDVLQAIADGTCEDPPTAAREALRSQDLDFSRWFA